MSGFLTELLGLKGYEVRRPQNAWVWLVATNPNCLPCSCTDEVVTMTTVGFGDYVPRSTGGDQPAGIKGGKGIMWYTVWMFTIKMWWSENCSCLILQFAFVCSSLLVNNLFDLPGYIIVSVLTLAACFGRSQTQSRCHTEGFYKSKWKESGDSSVVSLTERGRVYAKVPWMKSTSVYRACQGLVHKFGRGVPKEMMGRDFAEIYLMRSPFYILKKSTMIPQTPRSQMAQEIH